MLLMMPSPVIPELQMSTRLSMFDICQGCKQDTPFLDICQGFVIVLSYISGASDMYVNDHPAMPDKEQITGKVNIYVLRNQ